MGRALNRYRKPYLNPGEDPLLTLACQIPIEGEPENVVQVIAESWLAASQIS